MLNMFAYLFTISHSHMLISMCD